MTEGLVLVAHGTVDALDDLPEFLTNIRRGHAPPPELLTEVRRRYEAIGGQSPLNAINRSVARKLEGRLGVPVRLANRLFAPYPREVVAELVGLGVRRLGVLPLAQHSAPLYGEAVRAAAREVDPALEIVCAPNWGRAPELTAVFARAVSEARAELPADADVALVLTAHSLPMAVIEGGDPYEAEVRASADAVAAAAAELGAKLAEHTVAFQSQGMGGRGAWLGPDLRAALVALTDRGRRHAIVAPIGFLADHVEILYDLDIEANGWAQELGIVLVRSASPNDADAMIEALSTVAARSGLVTQGVVRAGG